MKRKRSEKGFLMSLIGLFFILTLFGAVSDAAIPQKINYQGYITNAAGVPVNGTVQIVSSIYNVSSGGSALWTETQNITVTHGVYNVVLGDVTPMPLPFDVPYYLGIKVGTDPEMTPRSPLTAVPYAFTANYALSAPIGVGIITSSNIQDGTITNADISPTAAIDFSKLSGVASSSHNHDATYVNEGQASSITSAMIVDGAVTDAKITGPISGSKISTTGLDADTLDGQHASAFALSTHNHDAAYVNVGEGNSITSGMIVDGTITSADLGASSVGATQLANGAVNESKIQWSLNYNGADLNGGLINLVNTSNGSPGNYPAGLHGGANGNPGTDRVIGVLGSAPGLGYGAPVGSLPTGTIGVAGASDSGSGVAGVSTSAVGVYGISSNWYGVYGKSTGALNAWSGVVGETNSTWASDAGVYGVSTSNAVGVIGTSTSGDGIYGYSGGSSKSGIYTLAAGSPGWGGYFVASASNGIGRYATGGSSGWAADFQGNVRIRSQSTGNTIMELGEGLDYAEGFNVLEKSEGLSGFRSRYRS